MAKNNNANYSYFFLFVILIFLLPSVLHADLPQPLNFVYQLAGLIPLFLSLWPITVVVVAAMIKVWLLKKKLSVPWELKPMEKLCLGTLGETIGEFIFLTLVMWLFKPAVYDVLNIEAAAAPKRIDVLLHVAIVIPWYCIMGAISMLILINFLTTLDRNELRRQYLKTSALLSLILPVLIILIFTIGILFFKGNA